MASSGLCTPAPIIHARFVPGMTAQQALADAAAVAHLRACRDRLIDELLQFEGVKERLDAIVTIDAALYGSEA